MDNRFNFDEICKIIGYTFNNQNLLKTAFTHSSYANQHLKESNERLEFLGDAILDFLVADVLYKKGDTLEGQMSKQRASIVSTKSLSNIIDAKGLDRYLLIGNSFNGDKATAFMMEDLFEAIVGAIYVDGGLCEAKKFLLENIVFNESEDLDYKTKLQEIVQKAINTEPQYLSSDKPMENGDYVTKLVINGQTITSQVGNSKKSAQVKCAKYAMENLDIVKKALK